MKKLIALVLALLLPLCALAEVTAANEKTVYLSGADVTFAPIADAKLVTRDSTEEEFAAVGLQKGTMELYMQVYAVYAMMFDNAGETEVHVCGGATNDAALADLTDAELTQRCESLRTQFEDQDYEVLEVALYEALSGELFIKVAACYTYGDGYEEYIVEYYTWQIGQLVYVTIYPYNGAPTEEQLAMGQAVVDSLKITAAEY